MISHVPASPGVADHWLVKYPAALKFTATQGLNRSTLDLVIYGKRGVQSSRTFTQPTPVAIMLPPGHWLVESSKNGYTFREVTTLHSTALNATYLNYTLDNAPFPIRYSRLTMLP